jgi:hypothetical protein
LFSVVILFFLFFQSSMPCEYIFTYVPSLFLFLVWQEISRASWFCPHSFYSIASLQVFQSALMGFAIGPLIGGGLASVVGLSWPFVGCSAALVASSAAAASLLPETMHGARLRQQQMQSQFHPQPPPEPSQQSSSSLSSSAQRLESQPEHFKSELTSPAPQPSTTTTSTFQLATQLAQRPALQGLGPVVFMNGFGQGAMPVRERESMCV